MRGQASVELLLTYGWMVLIATLLLGLMYNFGLFSQFSRIIQGTEGVLGLGSFAATGRATPNGNFSLTLENLGGGDVVIQYVSIGEEILSSASPSFPFNLSRGGSVRLNGTTTKLLGEVGDRFGPVSLEIGFDTAGHLGHSDSAVMHGSIQPSS